MEPEAIARRVWPGREAVLEPLGGGITNRNFKALVDGEAFVLRIGGKDTELLGIDRHVEHEASRAAARLGIGPDVVDFVEPGGYLVTRFVDGRALAPDDARRPQTLDAIARTLRALHDAPPIPGRFDSFRVVEDYHRIATERGTRAPDALEAAQRTAAQIERARGTPRLAPCHNDLLNANFLDDGGRVRIVDWEYAGMGDRFFDLANFSVNHQLDDAQNEELLRAYFGDVSDEDVRTLRLMRFMSDFREAMWGVVQQAISELDFDFAGYAAEHFERLRATASDPAFRAALAWGRS